MAAPATIPNRSIMWPERLGSDTTSVAAPDALPADAAAEDAAPAPEAAAEDAAPPAADARLRS